MFRILFFGLMVFLFVGDCFGLNIRQESYNNQGVLVCKPNFLDINIANLLKIHNIETLKEYVKWLQDNIKYKKEKGDYWQTPIETLKRKLGDCEDFAFLNKEVLRVMGYKTNVFIVRGNKKAHAICVFEDKKVYNILDNNELIEINVLSLRDVVKYIFKNSDYSLFLSVEFKGKNRKILFQRSKLKNN